MGGCGERGEGGEGRGDVLGGTVEIVVLHHARDHVEGLAGFVGGGFLGGVSNACLRWGVEVESLREVERGV